MSGPAALFAAGITPDDVERVCELPDDVLEKFPLAEQIHADLAAGAHNVDSGDVFLGAGHYMRTWGSVDGGSGQIAMQTRTRTVTWFGGYHGSATLIFTDANNAPVYQTQSHRYGVDGTAIGRSDLTVAWWENMGPDKAARATTVSIFQSWDPDSFQTILNRWVQAGKSIIDLITEVANVARSSRPSSDEGAGASRRRVGAGGQRPVRRAGRARQPAGSPRAGHARRTWRRCVRGACARSAARRLAANRSLEP